MTWFLFIREKSLLKLSLFSNERVHIVPWENNSSPVKFSTNNLKTTLNLPQKQLEKSCYMKKWTYILEIVSQNAEVVLQANSMNNQFPKFIECRKCCLLFSLVESWANQLLINGMICVVDGQYVSVTDFLSISLSCFKSSFSDESDKKLIQLLRLSWTYTRWKLFTNKYSWKLFYNVTSVPSVHPWGQFFALYCISFKCHNTRIWLAKSLSLNLCK